MYIHIPESVLQHHQPQQLKAMVIFPYSFLDRVLTVAGNKMLGLKLITRNEWVMLTGQETPAMLPTTILLEIMAQAAGRFDDIRQTQQPLRKNLLTRICHAQFNHFAQSGDSLLIEVEWIKSLGDNSVYTAAIKIAERCLASCEMYFSRLAGTESE